MIQNQNLLLYSIIKLTPLFKTTLSNFFFQKLWDIFICHAGGFSRVGGCGHRKKLEKKNCTKQEEASPLGHGKNRKEENWKGNIDRQSRLERWRGFQGRDEDDELGGERAREEEGKMAGEEPESADV